MPYEVEFEIKDDHIVARVYGKANLEDNIDLSKRVTQKCIEKGIIRLLVDIRNLERGTNITQAYFLGKTVAPIEGVRSLKTAILHEEERRELEEFFETTARNRGINLRAFSDEKKAFEWLLSE